MKRLIYLLPIILLTSCGENGESISELENRIQELEYELSEAQDKIDEYESTFDEIRSEAADGYDAISNFNWSWQLQEALDAFESIESKAYY